MYALMMRETPEAWAVAAYELARILLSISICHAMASQDLNGWIDQVETSERGEPSGSPAGLRR